MPDHETATPSDGGYRDRTGDLLLAKAQHTVHQGDTNGTEPGPDHGSAAAAATRHRTPTESLRETHAAGGAAQFLRSAVAAVGYTHIHTDARGNESWTHPTFPDLPGVLIPADHSRDLYGYETLLDHAARRLRTITSELAARNAVDEHWAARERHARSLDRSDAAHTLRVRADQAAGQQRHVRATISHVRRAVHA